LKLSDGNKYISISLKHARYGMNDHPMTAVMQQTETKINIEN